MHHFNTKILASSNRLQYRPKGVIETTDHGFIEVDRKVINLFGQVFELNMLTSADIDPYIETHGCKLC
jgi:hypothetical protein